MGTLARLRTRPPRVRRPLLLAPLAVVGVGLGSVAPASMAGSGAEGWGPFALSCAGVAVAGASLLLRRGPALLLALGLVSAGFGAGAVQRAGPRGALAAALASPGALHRVAGRAATTPIASREGAATFDLEVAAVVGAGGASPAAGTLLVAFREGPPAIARGDRLEVLGRLEAPRLPTNPGERTGAASLAARGIRGVLEARGGTTRVLDRGSPLSPSRAIDRLRSALLERLRRRVAPEHAGLAAALLLGYREPTDAALLDLHARTGVLHYLAVSGVHAILVAGALRAVTRACRVPPRAEGTLLLAALLVYAGITGFGAPVVRACVLLGVLLAAPLFRRVPDAACAIALSAGLGAALDPAAVAGPSYQLSHAAALGIAVFARRAEARLGSRREPDPFARPPGRLALVARGLGRRIRSAVAVSVVASLATTPVAFHHFGTLAPWSAPVTVLLAPLVTAMMLAGYGALLLPGLAGAAAAAVFDGAAAVEVRSLRVVDGWPGTPWVPLGTGLVEVTLACALLLALVARIESRRRAWLLRGGLAIALLVPAVPRRPAGSLRIVALDVGHGTAVVCLCPDGAAVLFDAGSAERREPGTRIVLPYLRAAGCRSVDAVVLSHVHEDHWNALPAFVDAAPPRLFVHRTGMRPRRLAIPAATRAVDVSSGTLAFDRGGVRFTVLAPAVREPADENDRSLALLVEFAGRAILLCGDPEDAGLDALDRLLPPRRIDALLAPHHGLPAPALDGFVAARDPGTVVISSGRRFDAGATVRRWRQAGIPVLWTRESGAIAVDVARDGAIRTRACSPGPSRPCPGSSPPAARRT